MSKGKLDELLDRAYAARIGNHGKDSPRKLREAAEEGRKARFTTAQVRAKRSELAAVEARCVVSRTGLQFLDELEAAPAPAASTPAATGPSSTPPAAPADPTPADPPPKKP